MIEDENVIDTSVEESVTEAASVPDTSSFAADSSDTVLPVEPQSIARPMLKKIIQGALLAAGMPLSVDKLRSLFDPLVDIEPDRSDIVALLEEIAAECTESGFELVEVGTGWRYQVRAETAPWVNRLWEEKPQRYSRALLETLSLIAYRQPITRGDIEEIRGVAVSSHIIKTLTERDWVKVVGHRDVPGRPSLYATTRQFLDYFNLKSLEELPSLSEIADFDKITPELDLALGIDSEEPSTSDKADEHSESEAAAAEIDLEAAEAFMSAVANDEADSDTANAAAEVDPPEADTVEQPSGQSLDSEPDTGMNEATLDSEAETDTEDSSAGEKVLPSLFNN